MGHYFIVLQLDSRSRLRLEDGRTAPMNFWAKTISQIKEKKAKLLCRRNDTGVSEEVREHAKRSGRFSTYVLFTLKLKKKELADESTILNKAAALAEHACEVEVVDNNSKFELIAASC